MASHPICQASTIRRGGQPDNFWLLIQLR